MDIPYSKLSDDVLARLVEEFVTRDGTDYGHTEVALETKKQQVLQQLQRGQVKITFDPETESSSIVPVE